MTLFADSECAECASCGPLDRVIDIVVMEHGLKGTHSNLEALEDSIVKRFYALHSYSRWRHLDLLERVCVSCGCCASTILRSSNSMMGCPPSSCDSNKQKRSKIKVGKAATDGSTSPSSPPPSNEAGPALSSSSSPCSEDLPVCPHHLLILNHPGNNGWKTLWSVESCAKRLIKFVVKNVQNYLVGLESKINIMKSFSSDPKHPGARKKTEAGTAGFCCGPRGVRGGGPQCSPEIARSENEGREEEEQGKAVPMRNHQELSPPSSYVRPVKVKTSSSRDEGTSPFSSSASVPKWKLVFHFVGFSMGGIILRAMLPSVMRKIEKMYNKKLSAISLRNALASEDRPCSHDASTEIGKPAESNVFYCNTLSVKKKRSEGRENGACLYQFEFHIHWKSFFSLSCPHLGSRVPQPLLESTYQLVRCLNKCCIAPKGLSDLLLLSTYMEKELLKPRYLDAMRKIEKKYFIGSISDDIVWNYSSCFILPPRERQLLKGWIPQKELIMLLRLRVFDLQCQEEKRQRQQVIMKEWQEKELEKKKLSSKNNEVSDDRLVNSRRAESNKGSEGWKERSAPDSVLVETAPTSPRILCMSPELSVSFFEDKFESPWIAYEEEEKKLLAVNQTFFIKHNLFPASCLSDLMFNGLLVSENEIEVDRLLPVSDATRAGTITNFEGDGITEMDPVLKSCPVTSVIQKNPWISEERWPANILPRERRMAETFLKGIGSVEVHLVNMNAAADNYLDLVVCEGIRKKTLSDLNPSFLSSVVSLVYLQPHGVLLCSEYAPRFFPPRYKSNSSKKSVKNQKTSGEFITNELNQEAEQNRSERSSASLVAHEHQDEQTVLPFNMVSDFVAIKIFHSGS